MTNHCLQRWGSIPAIRAGQFYQMRFARIMPSLLALLAISSLLDLLHVKGFVVSHTHLSPALFAARDFHNTTLSQSLFAALTFHINYLEAKVMHWYIPGNWDVLWSLSVEEMFYLFFPIVCLLCVKPRYFIAVMIGFVFISPFARTFSHPEMWKDYSYLSGMGGIAIGCLAAFFSYQRKISKRLFKIFLYAGLFIFSLIFVFTHVVFELGHYKMNMNVTLLEIGVGFLLIVMQEWYSNQNRHGTSWLNSFRFFGKNSYEIYLTHIFVIILFVKLHSHSTPIIFFEYSIILILCGVLGKGISIYFSEPMNRWIRAKKFTRDLIKQDRAAI